MVNLISLVLPYVVLISHAILVFIILAIVLKNYSVINFLGKNTLILAFLLSVLPVLGSLFYSEIMGFEPCVLCWWQRVFLFPLPLILGIAYWKRDNYVINYVIPLVVLSAFVSLYQSYVYLGGGSFLPCTAEGGACSKVYVMALGYISIPVMALTISLYIIVLAWAKKLYDKDSNA